MPAWGIKERSILKGTQKSHKSHSLNIWQEILMTAGAYIACDTGWHWEHHQILSRWSSIFKRTDHGSLEPLNNAAPKGLQAEGNWDNKHYWGFEPSSYQAKLWQGFQSAALKLRRSETSAAAEWRVWDRWVGWVKPSWDVFRSLRGEQAGKLLLCYVKSAELVR